MKNMDLVSNIMKKCIKITENTTAQMIFKYSGTISPNGEIVVYGFKQGSFDTQVPNFRTYFSYIKLNDTKELVNLHDELCDLEKELAE